MGSSSSKGDVKAQPSHTTPEVPKKIALTDPRPPLQLVPPTKEVIKDEPPTSNLTKEEAGEDPQQYLIDESVEVLKYKF